jgi:hypothetical protein
MRQGEIYEKYNEIMRDGLYFVSYISHPSGDKPAFGKSATPVE